MGSSGKQKESNQFDKPTTTALRNWSDGSPTRIKDNFLDGR